MEEMGGWLDLNPCRRRDLSTASWWRLPSVEILGMAGLWGLPPSCGNVLRFFNYGVDRHPASFYEGDIPIISAR
jgi:hypothetical protein